VSRVPGPRYRETAVKVPALTVRFEAHRSAGDRELATAALLDFDTAAIHEISESEWRVFFRTPDDRERAAGVLRAHGDPTPIDVEPEDWARRSQENLRAVTVGDVIVAPPWDVPPAAAPNVTAGTIVIVIEPSMGFGTAHHATTRLCLRALQRLDLRGRKVLDVGTGSGVLAIAAARLGAGAVVAVDNDADALAAARENVERNHAHVELRVCDLRDNLPASDIVVANLAGATLAGAASTLAALARGGTLVISGVLEDEAGAVRAAFSPYASEMLRTDEDGWTALACTIP
jgi:ribosomal protein L11 methyltransferase